MALFLPNTDPLGTSFVEENSQNVFGLSTTNGLLVQMRASRRYWVPSSAFRVAHLAICHKNKHVVVSPTLACLMCY
jgi:hypothetical protein